MANLKRATAVAMHQDVFSRMVNELYKAGLNPYKISKLLNVEPRQVKECLPENPRMSNLLDEDSPLVQKILFDFDMPVASEVLIENEKKRYAEYSRLEKTALSVMNSLLEHYSALALKGDTKVDAFVARLASDFIKVTHSARQELIQKYAIDKKADNEKEPIKLEFI